MRCSDVMSTLILFTTQPDMRGRVPVRRGAGPIIEVNERWLMSLGTNTNSG
jgi:hypothetical protein